MVCRDNFFNVKYAIDMAELTESYIKGFVETCFKAGVHEKQAAAMLDLVAESSAMEKSAAGAVKHLATGIGQLLKGTGNTLAGAGKIVFGLPYYGVVKPGAKGLAFAHKHLVHNPIKQRLAKGDIWGALMHGGIASTVPVGGLAAFQNWRADSDSKAADFVNEYLGDPEFLVFGNGGRSSGKSTKTYNPSVSTVINDTSSPFNQPGTTSYKPEGNIKVTDSEEYNGVIPESARTMVDNYKELKKSIEEVKKTRSTALSATERSRAGSGGVRDLQDELDALRKSIDSELNDHNRRVGIEERDIARNKADAMRRLSDAQRRDAMQANMDVGNLIGEGHIADWGNSALEYLGIRDTNAEAAERSAQLKALQDEVAEANKAKAGEYVDIPAFMKHLDK
jgi:hypothetical protein